MAFREDEFYIDQVINGNNKAFASLVDKHKEMVFTIVVKILRNREDAEEIAQDTFVKAFNALSSFKREAKFSTWLYRIAYNAAISKSRKKRHEFTAIDEEMIDNYTTDTVSKSVNELDREEQIAAINTLMEKLPEEENLLLTLFYKKEKTVEEISEISGYSQSNVKVKLYRIRKKMYTELEGYLKETSNYLGG
jgi:RNA polymerase sigma-70 factor (ECF subfamily)